MNETNEKRTALFVSPHLDDAVFSCGGTMAKMAGENWRIVLCTIFTKSVPNPQGFALACQLDKNLAPEIDYMQLRRGEDFAAARILNTSEILHLDFPEAPHRGYESAPELFAGVKTGDNVRVKVAEHLALLNEIHQPEIVFAPQGLGNHCDHLQTIDAVLASFAAENIRWYYDTPYAIHQPSAEKYARLPANLTKQTQNISAFMPLKIKACAAYTSQISFQFGGRPNLKKTLIDFHSSETRSSDELTENFLAVSSAAVKRVSNSG